MEASSKKTDRELLRQTEQKIDFAKKFLHQHGLTPNVYNLLGLVGAAFLEDFEEVDESLLADIEKLVRDPKFCGGQMSKAEQNKYFASDRKDVSAFTFTFMDRRKLQRVAEDARKHREKLEGESSGGKESPSELISQAVEKKTRKRKAVSSM